MEGIVWLFLALIVSLVALAAVLAGLRRRPYILRLAGLFGRRALPGDGELEA